MSSIILTGRDITCLAHLHALKVMTLKQINRDIFKRDHSTCYKRIKKFTQKKLVSLVPIDFEIDHSFVYALTRKGMRIVTSNYKEIIDGKRFKSNSVNHDLKLANVRSKLIRLNMVKSYASENQIQTYKSYTTDEDLRIFKEMRVDAMMSVQSQNKPRINIPLELEIATKSNAEYEAKVREIYYHKGIKFLFYICEDKSTEQKIKKIELKLRGDQREKIFYLSYDELLSSLESVTFKSQSNQIFSLN